ncbi:MAG: hypothetical protein CME06_04060 [Gemmatimonadetes bacterium]|nr:hypothetical protein [Gemmatimonadota bacterium]
MALTSIALLTGALLLAAPAQALPNIDPLFEEELAATPADEGLTAILYLSDSVPVRRLAAQLELERADRAARHTRIATTLRRQARRTQADLRRAFDAWTGPGEIFSYRP